jgi:hypothetical protein
MHHKQRSVSSSSCLAGLVKHRFLDNQNHRETGGQEAYSTVRPTAKQSDKWRAQLSADEQRTVLEAAAPFGVFDKWYSPPA